LFRFGLVRFVLFCFVLFGCHFTLAVLHVRFCFLPPSCYCYVLPIYVPFFVFAFSFVSFSFMWFDCLPFYDLLES
jgi:hypothetical protein